MNALENYICDTSIYKGTKITALKVASFKVLEGSNKWLYYHPKK